MDKDPSNMPITAIVAQFLQERAWKDEIVLGADNTESSLTTTLVVKDQPYQVIVDVDETRELVSVCFYSPYRVPPGKLAEVARFLNRANLRLALGRFACSDDGDANRIQFALRYDVEGGKLGVRQLANMINAGAASFSDFGDEMAAMVFTRMTADEAWAAGVARQEAEERARQRPNGAPVEL